MSYSCVSNSNVRRILTLLMGQRCKTVSLVGWQIQTSMHQVYCYCRNKAAQHDQKINARHAECDQNCFLFTFFWVFCLLTVLEYLGFLIESLWTDQLLADVYFLNHDRFDGDIVKRPNCFGVDLANFVDHIKARGDFTEHCIAPALIGFCGVIEKIIASGVDKKLCSSRMRFW